MRGSLQLMLGLFLILDLTLLTSSIVSKMKTPLSRKTTPKIVCTGKNEEYCSCVSPCGETCATLGRNITCNFLVCNPGCDCKPGFFRNSRRECVPPAECDCPVNEELDICFNPCPSELCVDIGKLMKCRPINPANCRPACKCKLNYRRDSDGACIPTGECPDPGICGENEILDRCPYCLSEKCGEEPRMCIAMVDPNYVCIPKCICKPDFCRNEDGQCIPKEDPVPTCGINEEYDKCPPKDQTCKDTFEGKKAPGNPKQCTPGCRCLKGYARNESNQCVLPENCCADPNAEVVSCPYNCPGGTCEYPKMALCLRPCLQYPKGCQCKEGYTRLSLSHPKCVRIEDCPKKTTVKAPRRVRKI